MTTIERTNMFPNLCEMEECATKPSFNFPGKEIATHCAMHKLSVMINVFSKYCAGPECNEIPSFNFPGMKRPRFCAECKQGGMVYINRRHGR